MGYDPSNINVAEELLKKKNAKLSTLRKQLKLPASEDPMAKEKFCGKKLRIFGPIPR